MTIKIEFNTSDDAQRDELDAAALTAFLLTRYPNAVQTALDGLGGSETVTEQVGPLSLSVTTRGQEIGRALREAPGPAVILDHVALVETPPDPNCHVVATPEPADPQPMTPEQAFGGSALSVAAPVAEAPSAAAPATAPEATAAPGSGATGVELDAEGLPWHADIHSSNHKKSANGVWMKRRGANQLLEQRVRAELRETYPAPASPAQRTMQAAVAEGLIPSPPVPAPPAPSAAVPIPPSTPVPPAPSVEPQPSPVPPPPADATAETPALAFARVMTKIAGPTGYQKSGLLTLDETNGVIAQLGLSKISDLLSHGDQIPAFEALVDDIARQKGAAV